MEERLHIVKLPGKDACSRSDSETATISLASSSSCHDNLEYHDSCEAL